MSKKPRYVYNWESGKTELRSGVVEADFSRGKRQAMINIAEAVIDAINDGEVKALAFVAVTNFGKWTGWSATQTNQELLICYLDALKFEIHVNQSRRDPKHLLTSWVDYGE